MTQQNKSNVVPALTSEDIIKLFAVTYLPLCEALSAKGLLSKKDLVGQMLALSVPQATAAWAQVAMALATVLERPAEITRSMATKDQTNLTLITGGKTR